MIFEWVNQSIEYQVMCFIIFPTIYFSPSIISNGNYRIRQLPTYSSYVTDLIMDMIQASPDDQPNITQARASLDWPFISMNLG